MTEIGSGIKPEQQTQMPPAIKSARYNVDDELVLSDPLDLAPRELRKTQSDTPGRLSSELDAYQNTYGTALDEGYAQLVHGREETQLLQELEQFGVESGAIAPDLQDQPTRDDDTILQSLAQTGLLASEYVGEGILAASSDIGTGLTNDFAKISLGGPMKAVQAALDLGDELAVWLNTNVADLRIGDRSKPMQAGDHGVELPNIGGVMDDPTSTTGNIGQAITQFLTGFALLPAAGAARGAVTAKAALTDVTFFDGQEENLANLVQALGGEGNAVVDYLANDEKTPELEGRLKSAVANLVPDIMVEGLIRGLDTMKAARKAKQLAATETPEQAANKTQTAENPAAGVPDNVGEQIAALLDDTARQTAKDEQKLKPIDVSVEEIANPQTKSRPLPEDEASKPFINWSKFNGQDDVLATIKTMAEAASDEIAVAQRGVRSNETTRAAAGDENAWTFLDGKRQANAPLMLSAEETYALRELWASSGEKLTELAKLARQGDHETLYAFRKMLSVHNTIQQTVMGVRTETARALQQWTMPVGTNADKMRQIQFAVETQEGTTRGLAARIALLSEMDDPVALEKFTKKSVWIKSGEALREYWINSILSGPKTHLVNILSNGLVVQNAIFERKIAGQIGDMLDPADGVRLKEASYMLHGQQEALRDMWRYTYKRMEIAARKRFGNLSPDAAAQALQDLDDPIVRVGRDKLENQGRPRAISSEHWDLDPTTSLGRAVDMAGSVINAPGTLLGGADDFFKTINYRAELHATAARRASREVDEGLLQPDELKQRIADIIDDPPEDLRLGGEDFAALNTFTSEPNKIAKRLMSFRNAVDQYSVENTGIPLGTLILPFVNTPANILAYTFDRTPLAVVGQKFRQDIAAGGVRRNLALARVSLGSAAMGTVYSLALDEHITGGGPKSNDWQERRALRRMGWQPYSIRFHVGTNQDGKPQYRYFAFNRMDPIGLYMGIAADMAEYALNNEGRTDADFSELVAATSLGMANNILDKAYLSGVAKLITAITESERYGERYLTDLASSLIPVGVKQVAQAADPIARQTWDLMSALKSKTPGFREGLPPRLDFWGKEVSYASGLGTLYDSVSPIYSSSNKNADDVDREFYRIGYVPAHRKVMKIGKKSIPLRNMPAAFNTWIKLTSTTRASHLLADNYAELIGGSNKSLIRKMQAYGSRTLKEALSDVMTGQGTGDLLDLSMEYQLGDNEKKAKTIGKIIGHYRKVAKIQTIRQHPRITEVARTIPERSGKEPPV